MNTRVGKRKNSTMEAKIEPPLKTMKKNELLSEYKSLLKKFEVLQDENKVLLENQKTNLEAINILEEKILVMENHMVSPVGAKKNLINSSVQTDPIKCEECDYSADNIHHLVDHMHGVHSIEDDDFDYECSFRCEHCGKGFHESNNLKIHVQHEHSEEVKNCKHFLEGKCFFGETCWFSHDQNIEIEKIKCLFCDYSFDSKSELMSHRKTEHPNRVKKCKYENNGSCQHGPNFCWYKHTEIQKNVEIDENIEPNNTITRLFDIIESFGLRLMSVESYMKK